MTRRKTPVKRCPAAKRKSRKKQQPDFLRTLKQLSVWSVVAFLIFTGGLLFSDCGSLYPKLKERFKTRPAADDILLPGEPAAALSGPDGNIELPLLIADRPEQIIDHEGYTVSYNSFYKIANWVAYELTEEEVCNKNTERTNKFTPDPEVVGATALNEDYTRTGFDRGHLAPAGDMRWSAKAMRESFYFSNICPQHPGLNRGMWKTLEEQVRVWALEYGAVYIATGPVIPEGNMRVMGKNRVGVPDRFYKVLCVLSNGNPLAIGFLMDNKDLRNQSLRHFAVPVDSVEKVTGIDFFYRMEQPYQAIMESKVDYKAWNL